jgi:hypothetical protein
MSVKNNDLKIRLNITNEQKKNNVENSINLLIKDFEKETNIKVLMIRENKKKFELCLLINPKLVDIQLL